MNANTHKIPPQRDETSLALSDEDSLCGFFATFVLDLTITSRCNLRCVYCAVSQESYQGVDMDMGLIEPLLMEMKRFGLCQAQISGHGETTIIPGWEEVARLFKRNGIWTSIISNFSRPFTDTEIEAFVALDYITVSLDTIDRKLLREVRRHADVALMLYNMLRIKATARLTGQRAPIFRWNCVLHNRLIGKLVEWAACGLEAGVTQFTLSNMVAYPTPAGAPELVHPAELSPLDAMLLLKEIEEVSLLVRAEGANIDYQQGLIDSLQMKAFGRHPAAGSREAGGISAGIERTKFSRKPSEGETRACLEPWNKLRVHSDGTCWPCCFYDNDTIGTYRGKGDVEHIMSSDKVKMIRRGLLRGGADLDPQCAHCSEKKVVPIAALRQSVVDLKTRIDIP